MAVLRLPSARPFVLAEVMSRTHERRSWPFFRRPG